ncbi:hypothetical protein CENSYa_0686 [Cenarchaeum symbiosum A]|uniref:Uncharacterized protein n=1 Tax=Cenarchaeum symbiosum (strain A) TaxID=414004 RepID=A0RVF2_CENSY|nr:hypothetical protein CENSYa_0686 [Cenarchaeum symbiosum A]
MILSSWAGYARSKTAIQDEDNLRGAMGFIVDLAILFKYFYLLIISTTRYFEAQFHVVIIAISVTYIIWDLIRYREYAVSPSDRKKLTARTVFTFLFMTGCLGLGMLYHLIFIEEIADFGVPIDENTPMYFMFGMILLILSYRAFKWKITIESRIRE